jgi:hypothetical protein
MIFMIRKNHHFQASRLTSAVAEPEKTTQLQHDMAQEGNR